MMLVGQFDEFGGLMRDDKGFEGPWERARAHMNAYRQRDENLGCLVVEPGAGHFAWSERCAKVRLCS